MPLTKVRSPSGSTPLVGTVMARVSPAVTLAEKLRADGGWLGYFTASGSGLMVTLMRPVTARARRPSG